MTPAERRAILNLLHSPHVSEPTRRVLLERLDARYERTYFSAEEFGRLRAAALRLLPHDPAELNLSGMVDDRLACGNADGWRYDDTPPDGDAYRALLAALPGDFEALQPASQDAALHAVQASHAHTFEDLLAELTERYVAHPLTQYRSGYVGFADLPGWPQVGPNELEPREVSRGEA